MHRSSTNNPPESPGLDTTAANLTAIPPDVAAVRKTRMNADLISAFKQPCPPGSNSSVKGVGLYTHVEGSPKAPWYPHEKHTQLEPEFLPIDIRTRFGHWGLESKICEDVKKVWEEVRDVVQEEEELVGTTELGLNPLKKRYGGLDVPDSSRPRSGDQELQVALQHQDAAMQEEITVQDRTAQSGNVGESSGARDPPIAVELAQMRRGNQDVVMGGTETGSISTTKNGNVYHKDLDPRLKGR
ncbi:hypothetical protein EJ02DRAFT_452023 [Clathrospora elynae]|uniref:Uncharacterized protein n=1 Tax=Clathrospora elynae TaxID=706981 RepID=A0A6A5T2I0_9PLEO|nr:hypothetical protein EJ02DRAFT_452023 [Clathrospora elynae]